MSWSPLHTAAQDGDVQRLERCLDKIRWLEPINVNAQSSQGHTPLHMSAANGHVAAIEYLIKESADTNARTNKGNTPLHLAAMGGRSDSCKVLISNGADVRIKNAEDKTAADVCSGDDPALKDYLVAQEASKGVSEV
mmetsp:Transcript_9845/g.19642  ORF Transcript_9845/g.19642 Transcript_9845/m.19642 type:complete len:137 (+) Transcript_9845:246-656(+)|eukprot:CAMPEP_0181327514 /NCGR_PEP_ID=MMETSP1101-20121128/22149_1 /TAXON_ID=46948 /ORGANISM="Rhodomonas abbreviata, Strain Caron Lab Isolate" /LENGTH=136 /DNA_ID=CAMNT_0023436193 /DNA_START=245 /DNA_END=655 /DNA_ORIENTATION=-